MLDELDLSEVALQEKRDGASFKTGTAKNGTPSKALSPLQKLLQKLQSVKWENKRNQNSSDDDARYLELAKDPEPNRAELQRMVDETALSESFQDIAKGYDSKRGKAECENKKSSR